MIVDLVTRGRVDIREAGVSFPDRAGGSITALAPTSLTLAPGSFTALIGPSGCGKSTLLNLVAGFLAPTRGEVVLDGTPITDCVPDVGIVFQQYALFPWFSALGNVKFALKRFGYRAAELNRRALDALAEVGLEKRAHQYPGQLSGGMKQRVALARTFAGRPKVLLMDEPFGALDAQTRSNMHELLLAIWAKHRTTVLFVTHDVNEALLLADRVHIMSRGPGRVIETIEVTDPRPRSVEQLSQSFIANRARIVHLLKQHEDDEDAAPAHIEQRKG
jgi:NitT/TauT family transport system ATP-binding protein